MNELLEKRESLIKDAETKLEEGKLEEVRTLQAEIETLNKEIFEKRALEERALAETREAELRALNPNKKIGENKMSYINELVEKRAIALGANGDSVFSDKTFEIAVNNSEIVGAITIEAGAEPNKKFALYSPSLNNIKRVSEDGTGSAVSTAAFAPVLVSPAPYMGYVPVSDFMLKTAQGKVETRLTDMFGKAFASQMAKEIIAGSGVGEMTGIFVDAGITTTASCAAAGAPKLKDLLSLTAKLSGKFARSKLAIVINPTFWASIMGEDTKFSYVNNKSDYFTFNGVRIIESDDAPSTTVAGDVVAVIGNLADYGVAVAFESQLELLPKTAGSLNNTIQGTMYFDGKVIVPSSFAKLLAV